jgi:Haem-binding domain
MTPKERSLKRVIQILCLAGAGAVAAASLLVHPYGPVKAAQPAKPLMANSNVDPAVLTMLQRACQNCHSEKTTWPWYSYVAPVSWFIESDVSQARAHMNLSHWDEYPSEKQQELLGRIAAAIRSREMPPARFTRLHPEGNLSTAERERLSQWTHAERRRLKSLTAPPLEAGQ